MVSVAIQETTLTPNGKTPPLGIPSCCNVVPGQLSFTSIGYVKLILQLFDPAERTVSFGQPVKVGSSTSSTTIGI